MRWRNRKKKSSGDRKRRKTDREICNSGNYQYAGELVI